MQVIVGAYAWSMAVALWQQYEHYYYYLYYIIIADNLLDTIITVIFTCSLHTN